MAEEAVSGDECTIPEPVDPEALERYNLNRSPYDGVEDIRRYMRGEAPDEEVTYTERITVERVLDRDVEVWDVHTTGERYWVLTNPTNLYAQRLFPSADYTLTFHIGLTTRIASRREARCDLEQRERLSPAWRLWEQAGAALDGAHEAADFQAVGMRCRECLLALAKDIARESMVPAGADPPKAADFVRWSELIANALASGSGSREVRGYMKAVAREAWQLVSWLTHASGAVHMDAEFALEATNAVLTSYAMAFLRFERGTPSRCPQCRSYRLEQRYVGDISSTQQYATLCVACGWNNA
jgi:hypothetical protein